MNARATVTWTPGISVSAFMQLINGAAIDGVTKLATDIFDASQDIVAVDTGELKASGSVSVEQDGNSVEATVSYDTDHCVYVEFGTGQRGAASAGAGEGPYNPNWPGMPAQPYLRPAFDENRDKATDTVAGPIADELR